MHVILSNKYKAILSTDVHIVITLLLP